MSFNQSKCVLAVTPLIEPDKLEQRKRDGLGLKAKDSPVLEFLELGQNDPNILSVGLSINGELRQESTTDLMVHSVDSILSHLSGWYTPPGDLIWTGTPQGVGPMKEGDVIEC